jgi:hypothetical protein
VNTHKQTKKYFNIQRGEEKMSEWSTVAQEMRIVAGLELLEQLQTAVEEAVESAELLGEERVVTLDKSYETSYYIINSLTTVRAFLKELIC